VVAEALDDLLVGRYLGRSGLPCSVHQFRFDDLALVERRRLELASLLERRDNALVLPADLVREATELTVLTARLEAQNAQGRGNDDALLLVVRRGNALIDLEALQRVLAAVQLVRQHSPDGAPEDLAGCAKVEGTACRVGAVALLQEVKVLQLVTVEVAGNVDSFTSNHDDPLTL